MLNINKYNSENKRISSTKNRSNDSLQYYHLFDILKNNFFNADMKDMYNILQHMYDIYKSHIISTLNETSIKEINIGFHHLFFERFIWKSKNEPIYIPILYHSFEIYHYLGIDEEENEVLYQYLMDYSKKYIFMKNPFYIEKNNQYFSVISVFIIDLLNDSANKNNRFNNHFKKIIKEFSISSTFSNNNQYKGGYIDKYKLLRNVKRTNILHNFIRSNFNNRAKNIIKEYLIASLANSEFLDRSKINSSSEIENKLMKHLQMNTNTAHYYYNINDITQIIKLFSIIKLFKNSFFINDAMGYTNIIDFINKKINETSNIAHKNNLLNIISVIHYIYESNIYITYGMALDPYNGIKTLYTQIYNAEIYNKIIHYIFNEIKFVKQLNVEFIFDKIDNKIFIIKIRNINYEFEIKKFNTIKYIKSIITFLFKNYINPVIYESVLSFNSYKMIIVNIFNILNNNILTFNQLQNKIISNSLSDKENRILRYILLFLLRLKLLGDHIQAFEASNSYKAHFSSDLYRILTTDDRVLASYCLVNNNINFISKCTLNNMKFLVMNIT